MDGKENRINVPKFSKQDGKGQHGNHPNYNKQVMDKISNMSEKEGSPSLAQQFWNLVDTIRQIIKEFPETKINDIKLNSNNTMVKWNTMQLNIA